MPSIQHTSTSSRFKQGADLPTSARRAQNELQAYARPLRRAEVLARMVSQVIEQFRSLRDRIVQKFTSTDHAAATDSSRGPRESIGAIEAPLSQAGAASQPVKSCSPEDEPAVACGFAGLDEELVRTQVQNALNGAVESLADALSLQALDPNRDDTIQSAAELLKSVMISSAIRLDLTAAARYAVNALQARAEFSELDYESVRAGLAARLGMAMSDSEVWSDEAIAGAQALTSGLAGAAQLEPSKICDQNLAELASSSTEVATQSFENDFPRASYTFTLDGIQLDPAGTNRAAIGRLGAALGSDRLALIQRFAHQGVWKPHLELSTTGQSLYCRDGIAGKLKSAPEPKNSYQIDVHGEDVLITCRASYAGNVTFHPVDGSAATQLPPDTLVTAEQIIAIDKHGNAKFALRPDAPGAVKGLTQAV